MFILFIFEVTLILYLYNFFRTLRYYKARGEKLPIRTLDLDKCIDILDDSGTGKPFSFGVVMPGRTFLLVAQSEGEKDDWLSALKWKMDHLVRGVTDGGEK